MNVERTSFSGIGSIDSNLASSPAVPGEGAMPAAPSALEPSASEAATLASLLSGDPIADAMLLESKCLSSQRREERERMADERQHQLDAARADYLHQMKVAEASRASAYLGFAMGASAAVGGLAVARAMPAADSKEAPGLGLLIAKAATDRAPQMAEDADQAFGFADEAQEERLASSDSRIAADYAAGRVGDAGDRSQELRRLEGRVHDLLREIQESRARAQSAATRA